jgi:hypothetical protein
MADNPQGQQLVDPARTSGVSANLCEALLMLRPAGDRASMTVSAAWSRALLPASHKSGREVQLRQEAFDLAEALAPRLRSLPRPRRSRFIGFVDALRGQPTPADSRPSGEVDFTLFDDEEGEIHTRGMLSADLYAIAGAAHLAADVVSFRGILRRLPRISRIDAIEDFERLNLDEEEIPAEPAST